MFVSESLGKKPQYHSGCKIFERKNTKGERKYKQALKILGEVRQSPASVPASAA